MINHDDEYKVEYSWSSDHVIVWCPTDLLSVTSTRLLLTPGVRIIEEYYDKSMLIIQKDGRYTWDEVISNVKEILNIQ